MVASGIVLVTTSLTASSLGGPGVVVISESSIVSVPSSIPTPKIAADPGGGDPAADDGHPLVSGDRAVAECASVENDSKRLGCTTSPERQYTPARFWELHGAPERLTLDVDATLITAHSEKEQAAGNYKGGYGFHPLQVYLDETGEALGGLLRPGNAGSNTADDHVAVIDRALAQIPAEYVEGLEILVRADSAGATYGLVDYCREANMCFSVGYELTEQVRAAILTIPEDAWVRALDQDGSERENGEVCEITDTVDLSAWPEGCRLIVRRERPHPGGQLSFTDHDGYRFQAILTDQPDENIAVLECRHRQHAHVEDRIRDDKDTGLSKFPFKAFQLNEVWLEIVALAHDLLVWTQALILDGELAKAEPKRLRYRLLHVAARLAFSGRRAKLHLQNTWPWVTELKAAFERLKALPATAG